MNNDLKQKSIFSYTLIGIIFVIILSLTMFLVYTEKSSAKNLNITGKQLMLTQRIALLCNNYYDNPSNENIKHQIQELLNDIDKNHTFIKNINNKKINEVLYASHYQYDNLLTHYKKNVVTFISSKNIKHLKIINYTNESLLSIAGTLVDLLTLEFEKFVTLFINIIFASSLLFIGMLIFVYRSITLKSISETQNALSELAEDERFIKSILDNSAYAIIATTTNGVITLFNKEAENLLGYKSEELLYKETPALFHKPDEVVQRAIELSKELGTTIEPGFDVFIEKTKRGLINSGEWVYVSKDAKEFIVKVKITALKDADGEINGYLGMAEDITELRVKEREIKSYLELIDKNIITSTTDIHGTITYSSEAFSQISGYSKNELIGKNHRIVKHEDMSSDVYKDLWETISNDKVWHGELKNRKKDGDYYWVDATISPVYDIDGKKIGYTAIRVDITDKKLIELLSITDGLTDLYNRRHFNDIAQVEIDRAKRNKKIFAFAMLDIDNFKKYNDRYGHQEGDSVLIQVAQSLKDTFQRSGDIVFRLGGEEFGAIVTADSIDDINVLVEHARAKIEALNIEHIKNLPSKVITASFGVVVAYTGNLTRVFDIDAVYKEADNLLYEAKESGRNKVVIKEI